MSVNYVVATWSGDRRDAFEPQKQNKFFYLMNHLYSLTKLKHDIDQITVVAPFCKEESSDFVKSLCDLPKKWAGADLVVLRRPNEGQSYGSYYYAYNIFGNQFDYYILVEDDYVFVQDNFDQILQQEFNRRRCGFLCSYAEFFQGKNRKWWHAAISNGITHSEVLNLILTEKQDLGELLGANYQQGDYDVTPQIRFSTNFTDFQLYIDHLIDIYRAPFYAGDNPSGQELLMFGDENLPDLLIPLQFANRFGFKYITNSQWEYLLNKPFQHHHGL